VIVNPPQSVITAGPSANQALNGGFELDSFADWYSDNTFITVFVNGQIITTNPHSGTYCANIYPSGPTGIYQQFPIPILVNSVTALNCYYRMTAANNVYLYAVYTDATYDRVSGSVTTGAWTLLDLLASGLTAGKSIAYIYFLGGAVGQNYVDDIVLTAPSPKVKPTLLLTYQPQN
jgi:hypothetical protein